MASIGIPLTICAIIAFVFSICNFYVATTDTSCVSSGNITITTNTNQTCNALHGCINYRIYFYVEAALLAFYLILYVIQCACAGLLCKSMALGMLIVSTLWSILSAYMYFTRPIGECTKSINAFIIISTVATLLVIPTIIVVSYAFCGLECRKRQHKQRDAYV